MRPVVVVGDVVTDVIALLTEPEAPGSDAAAQISVGGGGSGANTAAWLGAAGAPVTLIARVGDDAAGRQWAAELAACGVRAQLSVDPRRPTGTIVVVVAVDGERTMFPDRGANLALALEDLPDEAFAGAGHLHLSGYTLLDPGPRAAGLHALAMARGAGMSVSVDPSSAGPLRRVGPDRFLSWTRGADLCLPNREEARILTGEADPSRAARVLAASYRQVVITLGREGALWSDGARVVRVAAHAAEVVDSTGAGDAFTAGFLGAWLDHGEPAQALAAGARLAAKAVEVAGARPAARTC